MVKNNEVKKTFKRLLKPHIDRLFFPHGVCGQIAYYLQKQGYHGPHTIPRYMVPMSFSAKALSRLERNLELHKIPIDADHEGAFENMLEGIDLVYDGRWNLDRAVFVDMVKAGCEPDTFYLDKDFNNGQYLKLFHFLEDEIRAKHTQVPWAELTVADMKFWCYMFTHAAPASPKSRNNAKQSL